MKLAVLPTTVVSMGYDVYGGSALEDVIETEDGVVIYCDWVIGYNGTGDTIVIPEGTVGIADGLFYNEDTIVSLTLPDSMKYIGNEVFVHCSNLTTINAGNTIESIGEESFRDSIWINGTDAPVILGNYFFKYVGTDTEYRIPDEITNIREDAFSGTTVVTLIISKNSIIIDDNALTYTSIESIVFEEDNEVTFLDYIDTNGRASLRGTTLQENVMDSWYVAGNVSTATDGTALSSLVGRALARKIMEEEGITDIYGAYDWVCRYVGYGTLTGAHSNYAESGFFYGYGLCQGVAMTMKCFLDELNIPNFVVQGTCKGDYGRIQAHAWNMVYVANQWLHVDATDTQYGDYSTFMKNDEVFGSGDYNMLYTWNEEKRQTQMEETLVAFQSNVVTDNVLTYTLQAEGSYWVTDCEMGVTSVEIPSTYDGVPVTGIGANAFADCSWLESIIIPEGVTVIGNQAFLRCLALKEVRFPSTLKELGTSAFMSCVYLKQVDLSNTQLKEIPAQAFYACLNLITIKLPPQIGIVDDYCVSDSIINSITGEFVLYVYGYSGGAAEEFALNNDYEFISLGVAPHVHVMSAVDEVAATCQQTGNLAYYICKGCEKLYLDEEGNTEIALKDTVIPIAEHTPVTDVAVEPGCESVGKTEGSHCSVCDSILVEQTDIPAVGHKWDDGVVSKEPTCLQTGIKTFTCINHCGSTKTEEMEAVGHRYSEEWSNNSMAHWHKCVCGDSKDTAAHSFEWVIDKEPTEEEVGLKHQECSVCHYKRAEGTEIEKLEPEGILGDVNGDGVIDTSDAQAIFNHFMGISMLDVSVVPYADVTGDGNVDTSDAQMVFNIFMGII